MDRQLSPITGALIDPLADAWLSDGVKQNDERLLRRIVDEAFASSVAVQRR